jgi:hypothetical protein
VTPETRARWEARNEAVSALATAAARFAWPPSVLDAVSLSSEARDALQRSRETYQQRTQVQLRAFRVFRNRGDESNADACVREMQSLSRSQLATVQRVTTAANRSALDNVATMLTEALDVARHAAESAGASLATLGTEVASTASVWLVLAALGAMLYLGRK